jgi:hypothetical protein
VVRVGEVLGGAFYRWRGEGRGRGRGGGVATGAPPLMARWISVGHQCAGGFGKGRRQGGAG